ncbi:hypothetical protein KQI84_11790 [bacterium]|nr:hypothetical protein [bacterium]
MKNVRFLIAAIIGVAVLVVAVYFLRSKPAPAPATPVAAVQKEEKKPEPREFSQPAEAPRRESRPQPAATPEPTPERRPDAPPPREGERRRPPEMPEGEVILHVGLEATVFHGDAPRDITYKLTPMRGGRGFDRRGGGDPRQPMEAEAAIETKETSTTIVLQSLPSQVLVEAFADGYQFASLTLRPSPGDAPCDVATREVRLDQPEDMGRRGRRPGGNWNWGGRGRGGLQQTVAVCEMTDGSGKTYMEGTAFVSLEGIGFGTVELELKGSLEEGEKILSSGLRLASASESVAALQIEQEEGQAEAYYAQSDILHNPQNQEVEFFDLGARMTGIPPGQYIGELRTTSGRLGLTEPFLLHSGETVKRLVETKEAGSIKAIVLSEGEPVPEQSVTVSIQTRNSANMPHIIFYNEQNTQTSMFGQTEQTNEQGVAMFLGLQEGSYRVWLRNPESDRPWDGTLREVALAQGEEREVLFEDPFAMVTVHFTINWDTGGPLEAGQITAGNWRRAEARAEIVDGEAELEARAGPHMISVEDTEGEELRQTMVQFGGDAPTEVTLTIPTSRECLFIVTSEVGEPLEEVDLRYSPLASGSMFRGGNIQTDANGQATDSLAPGRYALYLQGGEGRWRTPSFVRDFEVPVSGEEPIEIEAVVGDYSLEGVVIDDTTEEPVRGARVTLNDVSKTDWVDMEVAEQVPQPMDRVNESGVFRFNELAHRNFGMIVQANDYDIYEIDRLAESDFDSPMEVRLTRKGGTVSGTIRDQQGRPARLRIPFIIDNDSGERVACEAWANDEGEYETPGLEPGEYTLCFYGFWRNMDGRIFTPMLSPPLTVQAGEATIYNPVAEPGGNLTVVVQSPQGLPFANLPIRILDDAGEDADWLLSMIQPMDPVTDGVGEWNWDNLPVGEYRIVPGPGAGVNFEKRVRVEADESRTETVVVE